MYSLPMNEFQRRIGVGERQNSYGKHAGTTKTTPVVAYEGPNRGGLAGTQTEHWSGRVDATVTPQVSRLEMKREQA